MTNKVAVIGGSGFLGTRLCERLERAGVDFSILDLVKSERFSSKTVKGDVCTSSDLESLANTDTLINLAAVHRDDVRPLSLYDEVNVGGAKTLCAKARELKVNKIVFTSSVAIYGFSPPGTDETGAPRYFNEYGRTKFLAEQVYKDWQAEEPHNRSLVIIRPTVIFGEGNRGNVYNLFNQIASRRFVMFGDGKNKKSMAYVENVAAFLEHSLSFAPGIHVYNYIDKPDLDMNTLVSKVRQTLFGKSNVGLRLPGFLGLSLGYLADAVARLADKSFPISSIRVKKFMGTTQFGTSAGESGFVAPVSLEDGLSKTLLYEFVEDNSKNRTFDTE